MNIGANAKLNEHGFFSSILIVLATAMLFLFLASTMQAREKLTNAHIAAIELEQVAFHRYEVEENIAKVIKETLENELALGNTNSEKLNLAVSKKIEETFEIFKERLGCDVYLTDGFSKAPLQNLHELSRTIVLDSDEGLYAEYVFTGGLLKDKMVACEIRKGNAVAIASLVPQYTIKVVRVG